MNPLNQNKIQALRLHRQETAKYYNKTATTNTTTTTITLNNKTSHKTTQLVFPNTPETRASLLRLVRRLVCVPGELSVWFHLSSSATILPSQKPLPHGVGGDGCVDVVAHHRNHGSRQAARCFISSAPDGYRRMEVAGWEKINICQ